MVETVLEGDAALVLAAMHTTALLLLADSLAENFVSEVLALYWESTLATTTFFLDGLSTLAGSGMAGEDTWVAARQRLGTDLATRDFLFVAAVSRMTE